jgi:calcineurin-like phosphoesterase family protein
MNEGLTKGWNSTVSPESVVVLLGDFALGQKSEHSKYLAKLNGYKILIRGNHDQSTAKMLAMGFNEVHNSLLTRDGIFMTHVPPNYDDHASRDGNLYVADVPKEAKLILCGHVHDRWARGPDYGGYVPVLNVGVDVRGYVPLTLEQILAQEGLDNVLG